MKTNHLLIIKSLLTEEEKDRITKSIKEKREDFILIFSDEVEYYKLD